MRTVEQECESDTAAVDDMQTELATAREEASSAASEAAEQEGEAGSDAIAANEAAWSAAVAELKPRMLPLVWYLALRAVDGFHARVRALPSLRVAKLTLQCLSTAWPLSGCVSRRGAQRFAARMAALPCMLIMRNRLPAMLRTLQG